MPKVCTPIGKRCQKNSDPNSDWAKARYRWVTQLLLRLGLKPDLSDFTDEEGKVEDCFDVDKLKDHMINIDTIAWWDEVHKNATLEIRERGLQSTYNSHVMKMESTIQRALTQRKRGVAWKLN